MRRALYFLLSTCIASTVMAQAPTQNVAPLVPATNKVQIGLDGRGDYKRPEKALTANAAANAGYDGNPQDAAGNFPFDGVGAPPANTTSAAKPKEAPKLRSDSKLAGDGDKARALQAEKDKAAQAKAFANTYAKAQAAAQAKAAAAGTANTAGVPSNNVGAPPSY